MSCRAIHGFVARMCLAVCAAMSYAHERGVIHRDLKPENIMVGAFHEVLVMDWGIAKVVGRPETPLLLEAGIEEGDLLLEANGRDLAAPSDLAAVVRTAKSSTRPLRLLVASVDWSSGRMGGTRFVPIRLKE